MPSLLQPLRVVERIRNRARNAAWTASNVKPFAHPLPVALRLLLPRLRLLCYPGRPSRWQILYKICAVNGYQIATDPAGRYDVAIHFAGGGPCELPADRVVLNRSCTDISKTHVAEVFERIFGYGLAVDPTTYEGAMVEKSDENYTHDGRILQGPLAPGELRPGRVYQRLIGNVDGAESVDLRTPIYGGRVPLVYFKRRPIDGRFASKNNSARVRETEEIYSPAELADLSRFAAAVGLDFGELDVLRDRGDGRIYVVDVANRPAGPTNGMEEADARNAVRRLARAFAELVHSRLAGQPPAAATNGPSLAQLGDPSNQ